jgi:hypothetical protein
VSQLFISRTGQRLGAALVALTVLAPEPARAQQTDEWQVDVAPFYFWAIETNGSVTTRNTTIPVFLDFADAADNLAAAFSFHVEARKGRWGLLSDLYFVRLSTDADFTLPNRVVEADLDFDNTIFEIGASYAPSDAVPFALIGGLRTYTASLGVEFTTGGVQVEPVDASHTSANVFGGFTYRPRIAEKWTFFSRADIGGGDAELTWSGVLGVEYRFRPWGGLLLGYRALGIDFGSDDSRVTEYDVTQYGPAFGLTLHWGGR